MFKNKLDNKSLYKLDKSNLYKSITSLPDQISIAWNEIKILEITQDERRIDNIIVAGMGGSALGARIVKSLSGDDLKIPFEIITDYHLPEYAGMNSWVILSSYSGTTEETLSVAEEVIKRGCKVSVICTGGDLVKIAKENNYCLYEFEPLFNPGNMPRMALGYNLMAILGMLNREGFLKIKDEIVEELVVWLKLLQSNLGNDKDQNDNNAKKLAIKISGTAPILIAAEHLYGSVYAFKNQVNENAKTFATIFEVPELNHHLMEGLTFPKDLKNLTQIIVFESDLYSRKVQQRIKITEEVLVKQGYEITKIKPEGKTKLMQALETIQFGEFVSFYLAMLNNLDPAPIIWVDYFKKRMSEI